MVVQECIVATKLYICVVFIAFRVYIFQTMFHYATSLIALVAVIYWYRYKPHPDVVFNIQLNSTYDYIIGKLCLIVISTYLHKVQVGCT